MLTPGFASPEASYILGGVFVVDAGRLRAI